MLRRRLMELDLQPPLGMLCKVLGAHRLACFGPTHLNEVLAWRSASEVVIETDHPVYFSA